jgi:CRISPR-associated protein Cmr4
VVKELETVSTDKNTAIVSLLAETHIHVGIGQSNGVLDLPIARERTTHYPFIPGSGVKGAFRVWSEERAGLGSKVTRLFGPGTEDGSDLHAGQLLCSDARLLLLPVRCLTDAYKWVTCPALLSRFKRDCARASVTCGDIPIPAVAEGQYYGPNNKDTWLGLEEREFEYAGDTSGIHPFIAKIVGTDLEGFVAQRLVVLSDTDFTWFAQYALPVMARNALDENKTVKRGALWHEESLAPDTIMYVLLAERQNNGKSPGAVADTIAAITDKAPYIQMGGNETIGQGWFKMTRFEGVS